MKLEGISSILALACWSSWNIWLRGHPGNLTARLPLKIRRALKRKESNLPTIIFQGLYWILEEFWGVLVFLYSMIPSLCTSNLLVLSEKNTSKNQFLPSSLNSWQPSANWFLQNRTWISELRMVEDDWSKARNFWRLANVTSSSSQNLSSLLQVWCAEETAEESSSLIALSVFVVQWWNECYSISNQNDDPSWDLLSSSCHKRLERNPSSKISMISMILEILELPVMSGSFL